MDGVFRDEHEPGDVAGAGSGHQVVQEFCLARAQSAGMGEHRRAVMRRGKFEADRDVTAGGRLGGFSAPGGSTAKERMLALEGIELAPPPPAQQSFGF